MGLEELDHDAPTVSIYPIALGAYRDQARNGDFNADAEATEITTILAPLLGEAVAPWDVEPGDRHKGKVEDRLSVLSEQSDNSTALVWVGHGTSNDRKAALIVPGTPPSQRDGKLQPAELAEQLIDQATRRARLHPPPWTLVVVEACGAGRFVELVNAHLLTQGRIRGVGLIGIGDPEGRGHTATAAGVLRAVVDSFDPNNTVIRLSDLLTEVGERLGDDLGLVSSSHLHGCVIERPQLVLSAPLDVYAELRSALAQLPPDEQAHFARKGMGSDFGELSWSFVGRTRERARVVSHLAHGHGLLAVTGVAGSGKSAVLGNVLLRTQPELRQVLVEAGFLDDDPPSPEESELQVDVWLHLSGLTYRETVEALADAYGVAAEGTIAESHLVETLLADQRDLEVPLRVVADALDESRDPDAIADVLRRLARSGACIVVGTRPSLLDSPDHPAPEARELLDSLGVKEPESLWVRRDPEALLVYLEQGLARLHTPLIPGQQQHIIDSICAPAALEPDFLSAASRGFLYVRLLLSELATRPELDSASLDKLLSGDHRTIFAAAMRRLADEHPVAANLLEALALAQGNGIPRVGSIWATLARSLSGLTPSAADIDDALNLGAPYIAIGAEHGQAVYRLAHRTFQEHFQEAQAAESALRVAEGLIDLTRQTAADPNPYLVAYLAGHVGEAGGPGWELLAENESLLDIIDPTAVAREIMRTAFGHIAMPPQLSGVLSHVGALSECEPCDRQGVRLLSTAWFTSSPPKEGIPRTWSLLSAVRRWRTPHLALAGRTGGIWAVTSFATRDKRVLLATASDDQTVRVWDPVTGNQFGDPLTGHTGWVRTITSFTTPESRVLLATGSDDRTVRIWNPATGKQIGTPLTRHTGGVTAVTSFTTPEGRVRLATASNDRTVRIWDPVTGKQIGGPLTGHTGGVTAVTSFTTPEGQVRLATASNDRTVRIWDPATNRQVRRWLFGHSNLVCAVVSFSTPEGQTLLATASNDRTVRIWNPATGKQIGTPLTGHTGTVRTVTSFPTLDGQLLLATASNDLTIRTWEPTARKQISDPLTGHTSCVRAITSFTTPRSRVLLASAGDDQTVRVWDPATGRRIGDPLACHTGWVRAVTSFTTPEDGMLLATASNDRTVRIWDPVTGRQIGEPLTGHTGGVTTVTSFTTPEGQVRLATASNDRTVRIWDPVTGKQIGDPLPGHTGGVTAVTSFTTPEGQVRLATAGIDQSIQIWGPLSSSPGHGHRLRHTAQVSAMAPFITGKGQVRLATASNDRTVRIWDPVTGNQIGDPLPGHTGGVTAVTSFPTPENGVLLVTASDDETVRVWDPTCSQPLHTLNLHTEITALATLPDGSLVVGLTDGWARLRLPDRISPCPWPYL